MVRRRVAQSDRAIVDGLEVYWRMLQSRMLDVDGSPAVGSDTLRSEDEQRSALRLGRSAPAMPSTQSTRSAPSNASRRQGGKK